MDIDSFKKQQVVELTDSQIELLSIGYLYPIPTGRTFAWIPQFFEIIDGSNTAILHSDSSTIPKEMLEAVKIEAEHTLDKIPKEESVFTDDLIPPRYTISVSCG